MGSRQRQDIQSQSATDVYIVRYEAKTDFVNYLTHLCITQLQLQNI